MQASNQAASICKLYFSKNCILIPLSTFSPKTLKSTL